MVEAAALLVPPLATDLRSRTVARLTDRMDALDVSAVLITLIDLVPSEALPLLAEQFNVAAQWKFLPTDAARRAAIKGAVTWHRSKGTPHAVQTALSWAGIAATVDDLTGLPGRWAEYQLALAAPLPATRVAEAVELARFAAPARAHLVRLYNAEFDFRPLVFGDLPALGEALIGDDSGVWIGEAGPKASFMLRNAAALADVLGEPGPSAVHCASRAETCVDQDQGWLLGSYVLGDPVVVDSAGRFCAIYCAIAEPSALDEHPGSYRACMGNILAATDDGDQPIAMLHTLHRADASNADPLAARWTDMWHGGPWRSPGGSYLGETQPPM